MQKDGYRYGPCIISAIMKLFGSKSVLLLKYLECYDEGNTKKINTMFLTCTFIVLLVQNRARFRNYIVKNLNLLQSMNRSIIR